MSEYIEELYGIVFGDINGVCEYVHSLIPFDAEETLVHVFDEFPKYNDKERTLMKLRYIDGLPFCECGKRVGISSSRASKLIHRCSYRLRRNGPYKVVLKYGICEYETALRKYNEEKESRVEEAMREIQSLDYDYNMLVAELQSKREGAEPIESCGFSENTVSRLKRNGICTVRQLISMPPNIRLGPKSMREIRVWLFNGSKANDEQKNYPLLQPISLCNFSMRTHNRLLRSNITTIEKLANMSVEELMSMPGIGYSATKEVADWFLRNGITAKCIDGFCMEVLE